MDRVFRIFNELHIPCYMLFDYDCGNVDKSIIEKSKGLLILAGEAMDAPVDPRIPFVGESAACFPTTWEDQLRREIPSYEALAAKARRDLGVNGDSGKPLIARDMARRVTSGDKAFVPPSIRAIISKVVAVPWRGSCLKCRAAGTT